MGVFCPKCHKDCIVKNGLRNGIQSYKCKSCNRQFIDNRKNYSNELKIVVVKLCEMKIYYRLIAKIFNIKHISLISYWKTTHKITIYNEKEIVSISLLPQNSAITCAFICSRERSGRTTIPFMTTLLSMFFLITQFFLELNAI